MLTPTGLLPSAASTSAIVIWKAGMQNLQLADLCWLEGQRASQHGACAAQLWIEGVGWVDLAADSAMH